MQESRCEYMILLECSARGNNVLNASESRQTKVNYGRYD